MTAKPPDNRRKYRIWLDNEVKLDIKARQMGMTKSRALNVLLAQALSTVDLPPSRPEPDQDDDDTLTDLDQADVFWW